MKRPELRSSPTLNMHQQFFKLKDIMIAAEVRGERREVQEKREKLSLLRGKVPPREASAAIARGSVFGKLKFESGIHRVQRIPVTEKSRQIHTSVVSIAILPHADERFFNP
ncbi:uncharacterized protein LOC114375079 [Glycine soja]|uniref:uncharacterized protein LOC114375079 n=1 Tax=Glycine soja TaxID=3848 RepID=UPI00103B517A|nr:uncharacterized protein LOC114375079 [Glycine soja]XP_028188628.1 uncharacterized protein LOC114375079 [Glycine soja]XP_028188629.1 uncharacterized protein LOC114375079 [Glycine soja]